ncbi:MAG: hypothetical protein A2Y97_06545 [Nitrospirae bacterium RBG_13_39_12]|nr:MAG: hypothetical protein A2Y97_06545 [Nitrospirae bacterium RBG_13_39_12]
MSLNEHLQEEIFERKRAEKKLVATKTYVESILANSLDLIITIKKDGNIVYTNRHLDYETGYKREDVQGKYIMELIPEHLKEFMLKKLKDLNEGISGIYETQIIKADGTPMDCLISQAPVEGFDEFIIAIKNITERKKMETELLKAQKLESVGILAGGIAHDFNNLLTAIFGNISLAKMYMMEREVYNHLVEIEKASLRAKNMTQQLLTFSKGGAQVKKITSLDELIRDSANFALRGSKVNCDIFISPELWHAEVDEGQISQVINNLIINAQQAMPDGGTIQVQADNVTLGSDNVLALKAGDYIKISVKDHGIGISEENIQKIFDPYFTTKPDGSGFGLSTAYSIVKGHDGHIKVESKPDIGTTLYIYIAASPKRFQLKQKDPAFIKGRGNILVMDDEEMVRFVTGKMLYQLGYEVEFVKNGDEAIKVYKQSKKTGKSFDAVIMDLTVPGGMGGKETINKLLKFDPGIKAVVASGYSNDPVMADYKKYGFSGVVCKPFTLSELGQILHKLFESKAD